MAVKVTPSQPQYSAVLVVQACSTISLSCVNHTAPAPWNAAVRTAGWTSKSNCRRPARVIVTDHAGKCPNTPTSEKDHALATS
jgi:hypothetical protein